MANEQTPNLEERLREADKNLVKYRPISPNENYDRKTFVKAQGSLNDLEGYVQALNKDAFNVGAREDLCGLLMGNPGMHNGMPPEILRKAAGEAYSEGIENMGRYAERNLGNLLETLDAKGMQSVAHSVPLYLTGKREHDEVVNLMNEIKSMESEDENTKAEALNRVIKHIMDAKDIPDWVKIIISIDSKFQAEIFSKYYSGRKKALANHLQKDGKPDVGKYRTLIEDSLKAAYDKLDEEKDDGAKSDIWKADIRPYCIVIAKAAHRAEKKELDKNNKEKQEKKEREKERQALGMAA